MAAMTWPLVFSIKKSKSFCAGVHVPSMNICCVAATLLAFTVNMKSLHKPGAEQIGGPSKPVVFVINGPSV